MTEDETVDARLSSIEGKLDKLEELMRGLVEDDGPTVRAVM